MGALTIAFDTTIVGALALPWVLLVIHLFFFEGENRLEGLLDWVKRKQQQAAVGVLLFALTYTLGSALSRTARDFFNDDDLRIQIRWQLFRVGVTEDRIVASVYCNALANNLLPGGERNPAIAQKINAFKSLASPDACGRTLRWSERHTYDKNDDELIDQAHDLFSLQEDNLLLKGEDPTLRLRQLHDQIMVLRGAAFNAVVTFLLCAFGWAVALRREKRRSWLPLAIAPVPVLLFAAGVLATVHHFSEVAPSDPPSMEFTLMLLGVVGAWLIWKPSMGDRAVGAKQNVGSHAPISQVSITQASISQGAMSQSPASVNPVSVTPAPEDASDKKARKTVCWQINHWPRLVVLSGMLTVGAVLGWWSTEVLYTQQVVYSHDSQLTISETKDLHASQAKDTRAPHGLNNSGE